MPAKTKILWVVNYDSLDAFVAKAVDIGATGVAIRTDNNVAKALPKFQAAGIKVFGWRWPSAKQDSALGEADMAADLLAKGMDGYFVDPEGRPGKPYDWDQTGLEEIADAFCKTIKSAKPDALLGVTSHYLAKFTYPKLPWKTFFAQADVLLPQAYWRSTEGIIGHGIPADNYTVSIDRWTKSGGDQSRIIPMAGELGVSKPAEIAAHAKAAEAAGRTDLHFYAYDTSVSDAVWAAVKAA